MPAAIIKLSLSTINLFQRGLSALHSACKRHQIPIAMTLIQAGCNINITDNVRTCSSTICIGRISF